MPFMLAFHVEPDDEPFLGVAFRIIDLLLADMNLGICVAAFTGPCLKSVTAQLNYFKEYQVLPATRMYL